MRKKNTKNFLGRNFKRNRNTDNLTTEARSFQMSKIRSSKTKFEQGFISLLKTRTKVRFTLNENSIKGKPDIVFRKVKLCVFLDSDFWHGWYYPKWKHLLKNDFWRTKIENNRKRDLKTTRYLRSKGWKVVRLWEHNIKKNPEQSINKIISIIS